MNNDRKFLHSAWPFATALYQFLTRERAAMLNVTRHAIDIYTTKRYSKYMAWILKTRLFSRWMRKTLLSDGILQKAVEEMLSGLIDADLGGGVIKKRVPLPGKGKRGGVRTLVATNRRSRWIFIYGFEKNDRENITQAELAFLQGIAHDLLLCPESILKTAIDNGELQEICHEPDY